LKILLDEDLPRQLKRELAGHEVATVREMRWNGIKNGRLLGLATSAGFDVFLTADRSIPYQQNVPALGLAVVLLAVPHNGIATIRKILPDILSTLAGGPHQGTVTVIGTWRVE
jgi:hypothetical protein